MVEWTFATMSPRKGQLLKNDNTTIDEADMIDQTNPADLKYKVTEAGLTKYRISDVDDVAAVKYYGFLDPAGNWYIMKEDTSVSPKTYRYFRGTTGGYLAGWAGRAGLAYDYYDVIF
jgi:hypothetical protein